MKPEIVTAEQSTSVLPINILDRAIASGADIANIEKLMDLQERWEKNKAKKAFNQALVEFQHRCPVIEKRKESHNYKYAPLGDIVTQIKDVLFDCGLSYRFEQNYEQGNITVTCIISHIDGHSESTTMTALADKSGSKNDIQAIGSAVTYLQRYTLLGALGITTADEDMDGRLPDEYREVDRERTQKLLNAAEESCKRGSAGFQTFWQSLSIKEQRTIGNTEKKRLYAEAQKYGNPAKNL